MDTPEAPQSPDESIVYIPIEDLQTLERVLDQIEEAQEGFLKVREVIKPEEGDDGM